MAEVLASSCVAVAANEPLAGSASRQTMWIFADCPKPWNGKIEKSTGFPAALIDSPFSMLGRLPDAGSPAGLSCYRWTDGSWLEAAIAYTDVQAQTSLAGGKWAELSWRTPPPTFYICTHGSRDSCCGRLGVRLAQAWPRREGELVYECSHLGGHRFAPTLLAFPQGRIYGRIEDPAQGLKLDYLRGNCLYSAPLQVVEAELARRSGAFPGLLKMTESSQAGDELSLSFSGAVGGRARLRVRSSLLPQSCVDVPSGQGKESLSYEVLELEIL